MFSLLLGMTQTRFEERFPRFLYVDVDVNQLFPAILCGWKELVFCDMTAIRKG